MVKVDEDCVVWPSVVDFGWKCRSDCCGRRSRCCLAICG